MSDISRSNNKVVFADKIIITTIAFYDNLFNVVVNGKLKTQLYDKRDDLR